MKNEPIIRTECDCGHGGHFFALYPYDYKEMVAAVCEADRLLPFWLRVKYAFGYIFGRHHLNYIEVILDRSTTIKDIQKSIEREAQQEAIPPTVETDP